jgi:hypothetical protein
MAFYDLSFNIRTETHCFQTQHITTKPLFLCLSIKFPMYATREREHIRRKCVSQKGGLNILRLNSEIACMKYPGRH